MAATAIDSMVLGNLFSSEAMRRVFSDESRLQRYLDVEAALAAVQARLVDPVNYLGGAGELVDRVLARFEKGQ